MLIGNLNNKKVFSKIESMEADIKNTLRDVLFGVGMEHVREVRASFTERKTGRMYIIKGVPHQASAPGEAPAYLHGVLSRSVGYTVRGHHEVEYGDRNIPGHEPYGLYLEVGNSRIKPRPHISKAADKKGIEGRKDFVRSINRVLRG